VQLFTTWHTWQRAEPGLRDRLPPQTVAQLHEAVLQLRGEAQDRQVEGARVALAHLVGGGSIATVNLLGVDRRVT